MEPEGIQEELDDSGHREVAVVSVDVEGHTELLRRHDQAKKLIEAYQEIVDEALARYDAQILNWAGDGSFGLFFGQRRGEQAVLAGIHLLHHIELLNLDRSANVLGEPLKIRVAALAGGIHYREPIGKMVDLLISEVHKLQKSTRTQEFTIGETIHRLLPQNMKEAFERIERNLPSQQVFVYHRLPRTRSSESTDVQDLLAQVDLRARSIKSRCDQSHKEKVDAGFLSVLHSEVKQCYEHIATFRLKCSRIDPNWAPNFLRHLLKSALELQRLENATWQHLLDWRKRNQFFGEENDLGFYSIAHDHGQEEVALADLTAQLSQILGEGLAREAGDSYAKLSAHLEKLANADEMERMAEFVSLGQYDRQTVCEYIRALRGGGGGEGLVRTLWSIADLVIGEEVRDSLERSSTEAGLFGILLADPDPAYRARFQIIERILEDPRPTPEGIKRRFRNIDWNELDFDMVWRLIVIAHPNQQVRYEAAEQAPLDSLWPAVAYHGISLLSLSVIARRLNEKESKRLDHAKSRDLQKIFFDCVKSRLERRIQEGGEAEIALAADMVEGFYGAGLFVETPYFKALEVLLALYESRASRFGGQVESLEARLGDMIDKAKETEKVDGTIPQGVSELPPAVRRHLAKEGCYAEEFAFDEEWRVAVETESFLVGEVLTRVAIKLVAGRVLNSKLKERMSTRKQQRLEREVERVRTGSPRDGIIVKEPTGKVSLSSQLLLKYAERKGVKIGASATGAPRRKGRVFIVMQFSSPYMDIHDEVIQTVCSEFGFEAHRASDTYGPGIITLDIRREIEDAEFVIADVTPRNANVYYELGYAHAMNKQVLLLADKAHADLPFDISAFRVLFYENSIAGKRKFEEGLRKHIEAIIQADFPAAGSLGNSRAD